MTPFASLLWPCAGNVAALSKCNGTAMKTEPTKFYTMHQVARAWRLARSVRRWIKQKKWSRTTSAPPYGSPRPTLIGALGAVSIHQ